MASRRSDSGGAGAALFGVLLLIGLVITYYWFFIAVGAAVGLFFAVRALVRRERERRLAAAREAEELAYRADRQHRWARRGDSRGVYGDAGAELMRSISPELPTPSTDAGGQEVPIAAIAHTPSRLMELRVKKPPGWRWAVFASVLVQRRAAVGTRLLDWELGYTTSDGGPAYSGVEVAHFVHGCMDELSQLVAQVEAFMLAPAFMGVFGGPGGESAADADGIVHTANRLMDYHDRFLRLAERCRDFPAPSRYAGLMRDCARLTSVPLDGYHTFIDDFVEFVGEMPELMRHARGTIEADPIFLHMDVDDQLIQRITKQVKAAAKG